MTLPIERFKNAYANWRYNPFTDTYMTIDKTEDNLFIPSSSPYTIQLLELPRKDDPSTVTVYCYDTMGYFTEVATAPAQSEFRVDYPPADGKGTGLVEFNQNDANKEVRIFYKATGSPVLEEFLNTKVSWPPGTPGERQIVAIVGSTPVWRNNPIRMFHEGNAVYHSSGEAESCVLFRFKKSSNEGMVLLELKGAKLHQAYYSEVASHSHAKGTLAGTQPTHTHDAGSLAGTQATHTHAKGTLAGSQPTHNHGEYTSYYGSGAGTGSHRHSITAGGNEAVTISGNTASAGNEGVSIGGNTGSGGGNAVTISGNTASTGTTAKTYPNALKVYLNNVDKTAAILAKAGLAALGDGTSGHAFVTAGTGEMNITDLITSDGFHEIKITQGNTNAGGRCLIHLEMY